MSNKKIILLLLLVILIPAALQLYNLTATALWHDEAFSALLVQYDTKEMLYRIGLDVHPPLYYLLLKGWVAFLGNSLFVLRLFSVFFGAITVLAVYVFVKEAFQSQKLAFFSSVLFAFSSFQIQYAMEARMYTLATFLTVVSSYFLLKALKLKHWLWWFFYALTVSAGIYSHYFVLFWVIAQGIFIIYWLFREVKFNFIEWLKNKNFQFALAAYLFTIVSFLPWFNIFLRQMRQVQENYWIPPMNIWSIPATVFKITTGEGIDVSRSWYLLVFLMAIVLALAAYFLKKTKASAKWLIFLLLTIPFGAVSALSLRTSVYIDRYFIFSLPFYLILITGAILAIRNKWAKNTLVVLAIFVSLIAFPIRWHNLRVEKKPGMAAVAAHLNQEVKPGEKVYVGSSFVYFTFKYYNQTGILPKLYVPGELPHFSGTALLSSEDIIQDFTQETIKYDTVWLINTTGFGNYQPTLPGNWLKQEERGFEDVYDYRGWIIVSKYQIQ